MSTDSLFGSFGLAALRHGRDVDIDPELARLLRHQDGVVARWQTRDPATLGRIDRRLRARTWQAPYIGVYVSHSGPVTTLQQRWAAVLACGEGAALTGLTVLEHVGVTGMASPRIHVAVEHKNRRGADEPTIRRARVCRLEDFLHPAATPPQVRLEYAALAAAAAARTDAQAHAILTAVVQQDRLTVRHLRDQLAQLPKLPRRRLIRESLDDIGGGAQSLNEIALLRLVRRAGLPRPRLQIHVASARRRAYIDGGWPAYDVWFEVDGELHRQAATWIDDLDRGNELAIEQGGTRLRWSGFAVRRQPDRVLDQATRALRAAGWSPG